MNGCQYLLFWRMSLWPVTIFIYRHKHEREDENNITEKTFFSLGTGWCIYWTQVKEPEVNWNQWNYLDVNPAWHQNQPNYTLQKKNMGFFAPNVCLELVYCYWLMCNQKYCSWTLSRKSNPPSSSKTNDLSIIPPTPCPPLHQSANMKVSNNEQWCWRQNCFLMLRQSQALLLSRESWCFNEKLNTTSQICKFTIPSVLSLCSSRVKFSPVQKTYASF